MSRERFVRRLYSRACRPRSCVSTALSLLVVGALGTEGPAAAAGEGDRAAGFALRSERSAADLDASWSRLGVPQLGRDEALSGRPGPLGGELEWNALRRERWLFDLDASPALERNLPGLGSTEEEELERLGRSDVDRHLAILEADAAVELYPLAWLAGTPKHTWRLHETALAFGSQHAFGVRPTPYPPPSGGSLYTVRGHPQSSVAGDDVTLGRAEYRFHVGRLLGTPGSESPSWDLALRAFLDGARVERSDPLPFGQDETLWGSGLGLELRIARVTLGFDWGHALSPVERVGSGSNEYHLVATFHF